MCRGCDLKARCKVELKVMSKEAVEIIGGRERRRRWSMEEKLRIVRRLLERGVDPVHGGLGLLGGNVHGGECAESFDRVRILLQRLLKGGAGFAGLTAAGAGAAFGLGRMPSSFSMSSMQTFDVKNVEGRSMPVCSRRAPRMVKLMSESIPISARSS